jgi:hypothetical protein
MSVDRPGPRVRVVGAAPARRVLLQWDDGAWSVLRSERIGNKVFMASSRLPKTDVVSGFWYELVAPDGTVLYRRVQHDPTRQRAHVPTKDGTYRGVPLRRTRALLQILLPAEPDDATLQIWGQQLSADRRVRRAERLASLPLGGPGRPRHEDAR